jgi:hypothetical protein
MYCSFARIQIFPWPLTLNATFLLNVSFMWCASTLAFVEWWAKQLWLVEGERDVEKGVFFLSFFYCLWSLVSFTLFVATLSWKSVRMKLTLSKWGLGSPPRLLKLQSLIVGVKTPHIGVIFISLERYQSVNVKMGSHGSFKHLQHKLWQKERSGVKLAVWLPTIKSR